MQKFYCIVISNDHFLDRWICLVEVYNLINIWCCHSLSQQLDRSYSPLHSRHNVEIFCYHLCSIFHFKLIKTQFIYEMLLCETKYRFERTQRINWCSIMTTAIKLVMIFFSDGLKCCWYSILAKSYKQTKTYW